MRILLVGDIHANTFYLRRAMEYAYNELCDRVFFLGDFGWKFDDNFLELGTKLFQKYGLFVDFLDGNHEDFDYLLSFPVADDGYRHIAEGIRHIPRGTILDLDGHNVLVMGGATSIDKMYRVPHISWWEQESITYDDMRNAIEGLYNVDKISAVFAHDGPVMPGGSNKGDDLWKFGPRYYEALHDSQVNRSKLYTLMEMAEPKFWYHGHHHTRYTTVLTTDYGTCTVEALDRDEETVKRNLLIVDTEDW